MEEHNRRPILGNNRDNGIAIAIAIPFDRGDDVDVGNGHGNGHGHSHSDDGTGTDSTGVVNGRIPSHRSEQREFDPNHYDCPHRHRLPPPQQQPPTVTVAHRDGTRNRGYRTTRITVTTPSRRDSHREKNDDRNRVRSSRGTAADKGTEHSSSSSSSSSNNKNNSSGDHGGKRSGNADQSDRGRTQRCHAYTDTISNLNLDSDLNSRRTPNREDDGESTHRRRYYRDRGNMNDENDNNIEDDRFFRTTPNHGSNSRKDNRYNNDRSSSRRRGASAALRYHRDNGEEEKDTDRYRNLNPNHSLRERSDTSYFSEDYDDDSHRRDSRNRDTSRHYEERSFRESSSNGNRSDRRRRHSKDYYYTTSSSDDDHNDKHGPNPNDDHDGTEVQNPIEPKEWPPSFQENGSAFVFDVRSAMFYERLSDFFYDPKSKLYYGNKKCAYFRYDDTKEPPFVEVQKMTTEQVEEQRSSGGIAQEKVAPPLLKLKAVGLSKPKIAIKFRTKKVKSSVAVSTLSSREAATTTTVSVSKAKQQQIANIGKWNEQQAELKQQQGVVDPNPSVQGSTLPLAPSKIKTTIKGEPICLVCKKKFPNLAKLRLHEKSSELHKKNLLKLEETRKQKKLSAAAASAASAAAAGTKRKLGEAATALLAIDHSASTSTATAATTTATTTSTSTTMSTAMAMATTVYTDRAERRRQLHGADLGGPQSLLRFEPLIPATPQQSLGQTPPRTDLLDDETNVGHQMLQKMGYTTNQQQKEKPNSSRISSSSATNKHLRKEWDRIEAMAQKSVPRYR